MTSRRSERLVNLTMALLATKRYLTKSEIFRTVEGYEGNEESKERMFERDKDALRSLGIKIDVRGLDPTFEDEPGYRILPESYSLDLGQLSGSEVAVLSLAAEAWRGAALGESAQSALLKLRSLGIPSDFGVLPLMSPKIGVTSSNFYPLTQAIVEGVPISFDYLSDDLTITRRFIDPFGLGSRKGNWYVVGYDREKEALRTFRMDRIRNEVIVERHDKSGRQPSDDTKGFDVLAFLDSQLFEMQYEAELRIRRGKGFSLRRDAEVISSNDEFERVKVFYSNEDRFVDEVLWHGDDVVLLQPLSLRKRILAALDALVAAHG
jgi:proteasome accessory factor B